GAPEDEASRPFRGCLWVRPQDKSACDVSGGVGLVRLIHGTACYVTKPCRLWDESLARAGVRALARLFDVDSCLRVAEEAAVAAGTRGEDLAHDRQSGFGGRVCAD